jgi:NADH:ubiquinone oxidoreductase subunit
MADDKKKEDEKKAVVPVVAQAGPSSVAPTTAAESPAEHIARLQRELSEANARLASQSSNFTFNNTPNVAFAGEDKDPETGEVIETWYHYRVDLPPSGGVEIKINGVPFFHGEQYKVTGKTLSTLQDIVARSWQHEAQINGSQNENAYRKPNSRAFNTGRNVNVSTGF